MKKHFFMVSVLNSLSRGKGFRKVFTLAPWVIAMVIALIGFSGDSFKLSASQAWAYGDQSPLYAQNKPAGRKKTTKPAPAKKETARPKPEAPKPEELTFEVKEFPDGLVGRRYNFVLPPEKATPPYNVTLASGALPPGLALDQRTGGINGEPSQAGEYELAVRVADAQGKIGTFKGSVKVWRILSVGEHGQFKGVDGFQMALNVAQDMDEIRIERGTYEVTGLSIPESKKWTHWIKISGGWNETFEEKSNTPEATILDGGGKESRILTIPQSDGKGSFENLTFRNSKGGAVGIKKGIYINCTFTNNNNSATGNHSLLGGAVYGGGTFTNCIFTNNSSHGEFSYGGTVTLPSGVSGTFTNCTFTSNQGNAVYLSVGSSGTFTDCTFIGNNGRAVYLAFAKWGGSSGTFTNCAFTNNSIPVSLLGSSGTFTNCTFSNSEVSLVDSGGAFTNCTFTNNKEGAISLDRSRGAFTNCTFTNNSANSWGVVSLHSDVTGSSSGAFTNCTFTRNNGRAVYLTFVKELASSSSIFTNCTFTNNSAAGTGGAVSGGGTFTNCTFTSNSASSGGGAVWGGGVFTNCTFTGNSAGKGEGGAVNGGESFVSCLFYKNSASSGGAIKITGKVINSTFYGNNAEKEGGAIAGGGSIINSIFYKNMAGGKENDITATGSMEIDYSLVNHLTGAANFGSHNLIMSDPKFVNPEQGDFHLAPDSPCINAGTEVPDVFKDRPTDLDGKPRVVGGKIDMGAYEWQGQ